MVMSRDQNAGRSHNITRNIENSLIERVEEVKHLGTTLTAQNSIQEEEQIEVRECLLSFGEEYFVLQFGIQKY
jgi:hypothetical protein